ncbi:hypothetical protein BCR36DRAFT_365801 [Piromyces finnis]|uniref:Sialate O-acetylesterase domain-containing protein n=1 Tax=Piromyces finnis TaxID=1754191 RepID=A0A1Y1VQ01_9FUNG|nr:hypothetical protein BCR36DRAFT_365801 [Piromyces finnis]|eukprot:ORX61222.1 hypothetical protein BCR36DRAFT_365801 [Piromyces finnis]
MYTKSDPNFYIFLAFGQSNMEAVVGVSGSDILPFDKDQYQNYTNIIDYEWYQKIMNYYGRNPYGRLIEMGEIAKRDSVIKGILMHQGENNAEVLFLVGEVAQTNLGGKNGHHNEIINRLPEIIPTVYIISSEGLMPMKDRLHFASESFVTLGERFADKMLNILQIKGCILLSYIY